MSKNIISLRSEQIKKVEYPPNLEISMLEKWMDTIPVFSHNDPEQPEWHPSPHIDLNLSGYGYGEVVIKDESANKPLGVFKSRAAWEITSYFRTLADSILHGIKIGKHSIDKIKKQTTLKLSLITSGNEGAALAKFFEKYDLPPPNILLDKNISPQIIETLKRLRMNIFLVDLSKKINGQKILRLTKNIGGIDLTSNKVIESNLIFYDWLVHEAFNEKPDLIFMPYGSGRLMENFLSWQRRTMQNYDVNKDPRLKIEPADVSQISILGAEPLMPNSSADKLTAPSKPFVTIDKKDIKDFSKLNFTGSESGINKIEEEFLKEAFAIFEENGIVSEPSGAAGLALYLKLFREKFSNIVGKKVMIINTGRGIWEDQKNRLVLPNGFFETDWKDERLS